MSIKGNVKGSDKVSIKGSVKVSVKGRVKKLECLRDEC